jgi:voltage-gated potassium channel
MRSKPKYSIPYHLFMLILSVILIGVLLFDLMGDLNSEVKMLLKWTDYCLCLLFAFDFIYQIATTNDRKKYIFTWGLIDLASCIPVLGWGRIARIVRILKLLKAVKTTKDLFEVLWRKRSESVLLTACTLLFSGVVFGSIAVLQCEAVDGNIQTASDALWWTFCTMLKGGCENYDPVTSEGRLVSVVLMFVGTAINGTIIAFVASLIISNVPEKD